MWVIVMLVVFGGSGVSAFIAFFNAATTTATAPTTSTPTVQATKPVPKPSAALPHTSKPAVAATTTPTPTPPAEDPAKPEVAAVPAIDLQQYQALTGCGCRGDVERDGRKDQIDLYLRAGASTVISPTGTDNFVNTTFAVAGEGLKPFDLPATEETAPATKYHAGRIGMGVGCENDTMIIAALDKVSAWSLSKHELMWTKPLSPAFSRFAEGKASVNCSAITVNGGVAHVRTEGGMKQLRIDTGDDATTSRPSTSPSPSKPPTPTKTEPAKAAEPTKPVPAKTEPEKSEPKKKQSKPPIPPVPPPDDKKKGKKGKRAAGK